jgi:hypothetical protein
VTFDVRGGDMFLLRIDGLSSEVDEASMAQALLPGSRTSLP